MIAEISSPRQGGFFWDELDAASGVRGGWRRDPDGDHHTAGAVRWRCQAWLCQQQGSPNNGSHLPDLFLCDEGSRLYRSGAPGIDGAVRRKRRCAPKALPRDQVQMHPRARGGVGHTDLNRGTHESLRLQGFHLLIGRKCSYDRIAIRFAPSFQQTISDYSYEFMEIQPAPFAY